MVLLLRLALADDRCSSDLGAADRPYAERFLLLGCAEHPSCGSLASRQKALNGQGDVALKTRWFVGDIIGARNIDEVEPSVRDRGVEFVEQRDGDWGCRVAPLDPTLGVERVGGHDDELRVGLMEQSLPNAEDDGAELSDGDLVQLKMVLPISVHLGRRIAAAVDVIVDHSPEQRCCERGVGSDGDHSRDVADETDTWMPRVLSRAARPSCV
jgi:hypothetical protein